MEASRDSSGLPTPSSGADPLVAVVILNWNGGDDTLQCLASVSGIDYRNLSIIVVDNGSTDGSVAAVRARYREIDIIENCRNLGYAGGNNVGIRRALENDADFLLILNNDTRVAPDLIDRFVDSARRYPDAGIFSARVMYWDRPDTVWFDGARWNDSKARMEWPGQGLPEAGLPAQEHESDYASGAAMFLRAEVIKQIGCLDEKYYLVWEEADWCFRARQASWKCMVVPSAKVWHKIGVSFGSEASPLRTYFSIRNQLLWSERHASLSARFRIWLRMVRRLVPRLMFNANARVPFTKKAIWGVRDFLLALCGKGSRPGYLAARQAILDFVRRRFGDCPALIRELNESWRREQQKQGRAVERLPIGDTPR
jgi:GT2 family glycosyltransferase